MTTTLGHTMHTLREAFSHFPQGVVLVGAEVDGISHGLVASTFTAGVSLDPPLASVAVQRSSSTWPVLRRATSLGVSLLGAHQVDQAKQLAAPDRDRRFLGIETAVSSDGALILPDSPVTLRVRIHDELGAGDHTIGLLEILELNVADGPEALLFHRSTFKNIS